MPTFRHRVELDHPVEEVFAWHTRPGAFERLTPPWESVRVVEREGGIRPGARVVLELRKGPATLRWEVEHGEFEENRLFVDTQVRGPFGAWRHEHRFEPLDGGRCALEDVIEWEAPLGSLGEAFGGQYIESNLERLFRFRGTRLADDLSRHRWFGGSEALTVAVTGSSGMVGQPLVDLLRSGGHRVLRLRRGGAEGDDEVRWDPARGEIDAERLEGVDAVVHLAGEPIVGVRWTDDKRKAIVRSREVGTLTLARALAGLRRRPRVLVSASAVGFYGDRSDEVLTEEASSGEGFLAEVCRRWESATSPARTAGIRVVRLRTGIVLSPTGGVLGTLLLPFRSGVGGRVGKGTQYMSWIDLDDHLGLILHAIRRDAVSGAMNATAPSPLPNAAFTDVLGRVLRRPTLIPVPSPAVKALMGEMGTELLLFGQRAVPAKAEATGFEFLRPDLEDALRFHLGRAEG
ncbi:MAG: TIGR01777 family protein [Gemmatimonadales bacterium]|nr:MAG: TIGR01777 family protein [Gemmatimonadales bacterium]